MDKLFNTAQENLSKVLDALYPTWLFVAFLVGVIGGVALATFL